MFFMNDMNSSKGTRINYLDALKCLGIIMVVEGHVCFFGMGIDAPNSISEMLLYLFNMPLFFFISGFLVRREALSFKDTLKRLFHKFIFLVVPALIFYVLRQFYLHKSPLDFFLFGAGGYWFTITLWECFFIYYLSKLLIKNEILHNAFLLLLALAGVVYMGVSNMYGPKVLELNRLMKYFQFFVLGIFAMKYKETYERLVRNEWLKATSLIVFFFLLFILNNNILPKFVLPPCRDIVLRYLGTFLVVSWFVCHEKQFENDTWMNRAVLRIGKYSLAIYLLQYFFLPDLTSFPSLLDGLDGFTMHIIAFAYTAVIVAVCSVFITVLSNSKYVRKFVLGQK